MFRCFLFFIITSVLSTTALAQTMSLDQCFPLIQQAETNPDSTVYDQCGFNVLSTAISTWVPVAQQHKFAHALYEICTRHPTYPQSATYCMEAAKLGDGPAVAWAGDFYFKENQIPKAMSYYNYALQRGGLTSEREGQILANLGYLYAKPDSAYYNESQAVPLLKRAAQQRSALANNIMGFLTYWGKYGIKPNSKEAFAYFWRAILLGCPAAEENIGFFHLLHQNQLSREIAIDAMSQRMFSCEASADQDIVISGETGDLTINLYHLSFTPEECADINYYAERLVDSRLPFTGKEKCGFSGDMSQITTYLSQRDTRRALENTLNNKKNTQKTPLPTGTPSIHSKK